MKMYVGVQIWLRAFVTEAQDESELRATPLGFFTPGEETSVASG
jgi:hypothetical protein